MKLWKILGLTALAAALIPYRVERNEEDDSAVYESLLLRVKSRPIVDEETGHPGRSIDVGFLPMLHRDEEDEAEDAAPFVDVDYNDVFLGGQEKEDEKDVSDMTDAFDAAASAAADAVRDYVHEGEDEAPRAAGFADPKIVVTPAE